MSNYPLRPNVCLLIYNSEGLLFFGERFGSPGVWQLPQGGIEEECGGLEDNALREASEELGVPSESLTLRYCLEARHSYEWPEPKTYGEKTFRGQAQRFCIIEYSGTDSEINLELHEAEFMSWRWATPDNIRKNAEAKRQAGYLHALEEFEAWGEKNL